MSLRVTVALVGDDRLFTGGPVDQREWTKPYGERRTVELEVSENDTLRDVLRIAAERLGVTYSATHIAFYTDADEREFSARQTWLIVVPDDEGRATWRAFKAVRYGDLLRASEAGQVEGDPLRPYLILAEEIGDGAMPTWQAFLEMWGVFKDVLSVTADAGGAAMAVQLLRDLFRRSEEADDALTEHSSRWDTAGADPYVMNLWLDEKAWHSSDLADLLGCSTHEAEAVLWAFGFGRAPSGLWRRGENETAKLLDGNLGITMTAGISVAPRKQLAAELRTRVEQLANTGQAPPPADWRELRWLRPSVPVRAMIAWEERTGFVGRIRGLLRR